MPHPAQHPGLLRPRLTRGPLHLVLVDYPRPQAGFPSPAAPYVEKTLDLHEFLVRNPISTFYLRAEGDSMTDVFIHSGDVLVVDRSVTPRRGSIVVATVGDNDNLLVKEFNYVDGRPALLSRHAGSTIPRAPLYISEQDQVEVWGVVVGTVRRF